MTQIAVLLPCYNEEATIAQVVRAFQKALPSATIYVYDNNSTDGTKGKALAAGAIVRQEPLQGKGHVVRRMFADVEAEIYVMADGDDTYDATLAPRLIHLLESQNLDMVVGTRKPTEELCYRAGHAWGNRLFTWAVTLLFGRSFTDILSGYRVFSRRFVKSFPILSGGFEIETELTVHALSLKLPTGEIETPYAARPEGSLSKLSTFKDGWRISKMILFLMKEISPFMFFGGIFMALFLLSILASLPVIWTYLETGLVPRLPTVVLSATLLSLSFLALASGIILDSVSRGRMEMKRLAYLLYTPPGHPKS